MDIVKEIFAALDSRIRSPIAGSIIVSILAINWKAFFFLFFSGELVRMRFIFFDANTTIWSLIIYPIALGVALSIIAPWITYFGSFVAEFPIRKRKLLQDESAHKILEIKNRLSAERENANAIFEQTLIAQAQRDAQAKEIEDDEIREELLQNIKEGRKDEEYPRKKDAVLESKSASGTSNGENEGNIYSEIPLSQLERKILNMVVLNPSGEVQYVERTNGHHEIKSGNLTIQIGTHRKDKLEHRSALTSLVEKKLLGAPEAGRYIVERLAYNYHDWLKQRGH